MKTKCLMTILAGFLVVSVVASAIEIPANDKAKKKAKAPDRSPVIELVDENWDLEVGGPHVFIGFTRVPGPSEQGLVRAHGGVIKYSYTLVPAIAASIPEAAIAGLLQNPHITGIEPDGTVYALDHPTGDSELDSGWGVAHIGSGVVHAGGNTGFGVKVAVIDSGINYNHLDLNDNYAGGHDFVNNDTDPMDDNGHGTHVAGTVAAEDDGFGVVGVAPQASLYALKVLSASGSGSWSDIIAALQWAVNNGIQVTNNSYGSSLNPGGTVKAAFDNSAAAGILHVASAGNSGNPRGKGNNVGYPARFASVIAVAATDKNNKRASFSSTGDTVELAAPGVSINSTSLGGGYVAWNGTSMASPHVAGTAALVIAAGITDITDVRTQLQTTADDLGDTGRDPQYGYGLVDAYEAAAPSGPIDLSITTTSLPDGTEAEAYSAILKATGGTLPYSWTITDGVLPGGLSLTSTTGEISGTPTTEENQTFTVMVTDDTEATDSQELSITINTTPTGATTVSVDSVTYATQGGRNQDKNLLITVPLVDDLNGPVSDASVSIRLDNTTKNRSWTGTGTTGADGTVTFSLKNALSGSYTTKVTNVTATGLTWDGFTPTNGFDK